MAELKFITLAEIKQQCRIESDFTLEDDRLTSYGLSAESTLAQYMGRGKSVTAMIASFTEEYGEVPEDIKNAALMLVNVWYKHRVPVENVSLSAVPYTFEYLIKPYMEL